MSVNLQSNQVRTFVAALILAALVARDEHVGVAFSVLARRAVDLADDLLVELAARQAD
jgi:hypothetical protein